MSLNIHSFFGLLTRASDPGHGELLLAQQRDDQVVFVVAGDGGHHVGLRGSDAVSVGTSQASPRNHVTPIGVRVARPCVTTDVSLSTSVTL